MIKFLITVFLISGCAQLQKESLEQMKYNQTVGQGLSVHNYGEVYFSGQPSDEDFRQLKKQGFTQIINLRKDVEDNYIEKSEADLVKGMKMDYAHIPMDLSKPLTDQYINEIARPVRAARKSGKVLVHCSSGQRVALWAGGHFYKDHGYSRKNVELLVLNMGLEKEVLKDKLKEYTTK